MQWNVLNVVRMVLTAATAFFLFAAFRTLDRVGSAHQPSGDAILSSPHPLLDS